MKILKLALLVSTCAAYPASGQSETAQKFGARESVEDISLSPNGQQVAWLEPIAGRGTMLHVADVEGGKTPVRVLSSDAKPLRLNSCDWASNNRLVCRLYGINKASDPMLSFSRLIAVNTDGKEIKLLGERQTDRTLEINQFDGTIIGWPQDDNGDVLMARNYVPETTIGTSLASSDDGLGVDRINTLTLKKSREEAPRSSVIEYIADTNGQVRLMGSATKNSSGYLQGSYSYLYRVPGDRTWKAFSRIDGEGNGLNPVAADAKANVAYAFGKKDGRVALFKVSLDGSLKTDLVLAHDKVDIANTLRIGRAGRVIGADVVTDKRISIIFDPEYKLLSERLSKALPGRPAVRFVGASRDENRLLLSTASDVDPGTYYVFDKTSKQLNTIIVARPQLESTKLAEVKPISYPAGDGTTIPGYLTLPPGSAGKALPMIVMPHGGPASRDEWGFDWIAQYFAALGYAVLQPNFRGSAGYGDGWYVDNGFKSWRIAIGDVNDAAKWAIAQGIADKSKMAIFGWSYGGYAALQSSVLDPDLFKAIVAVAPVTDLARLKEEARDYDNFNLVSKYVGSGEHIISGSPRKQAGSIKAPVLMFSGDLDLNVNIAQAKAMDVALKEKGKSSELIVYPGLDHSLVDSATRASMLQKSSDFFKRTLGLP